VVGFRIPPTVLKLRTEKKGEPFRAQLDFCRLKIPISRHLFESIAKKTKEPQVEV
jgi:hypothetical protein